MDDELNWEDIPDIEILEDDSEFIELDQEVIALENLGAMINEMIDGQTVTSLHVASLESIAPGCLLDDIDVLEYGGVFSKEAYHVSMEKAFNTEFNLAMYLSDKFFRFLGKSALSLAAVTKSLIDDKSINSFKSIISNTIHHQETMRDVKWSDLSAEQKQKIVKLLNKFSGRADIGEKEALECLNALKTSKTGLEVMSKFYLPKYSNLLIPIFYIPSSDYKAIVNFFDHVDKTMMPKVDTNLNIAIGKLSSIMEKRDWQSLGKFDDHIFGDEEKSKVWTLAKHVKAPISPNKKFAKNLGKVYGATTLLLDHDRSGKIEAPKFHQDLSHSVMDLERIKNDIISISDIMVEMNRKAETKAGGLFKELRKFRSSKTLKESLQNNRVTNKYSNANYSRVMRELKDLSVFCAFMGNMGESFLKTYMSIITRVNHLNNNATKVIIEYNKIVGSKHA